MKKILILLFTIIVVGISYGQSNIDANTIKLRKFIYSSESGNIDTIISHDPDSIGQFRIKNVANPIDFLDAVNYRTLISTTSTSQDSVRIDTITGYLNFYLGGAIIDTAKLDGRYVVGDSLDFMSRADSLIDFIIPTQLTDSLDILRLRLDVTVKPVVYSITLPINGTLAGSVAAAIETTDYPTGWILSTSGGDLQVQHNLGRYAANPTIFYNTTGSSYRQLRNFDNAYSGVLNVDSNNVTIESISTFYTAYKLKIYILFE